MATPPGLTLVRCTSSLTTSHWSLMTHILRHQSLVTHDYSLVTVN